MNFAGLDLAKKVETVGLMKRDEGRKKSEVHAKCRGGRTLINFG